MPILRGLLRFVLIWGLTGLAEPYITRGFDRLARRAPKGSFLEAMLLELSTSYSIALVRFVALALTEFIIRSSEYLFEFAAALRVRPGRR